MTSQFQLGQSVRLRARLNYGGSTAAPVKIIRVMPDDGGEQQYRVKSESEAYERVVKESELSR
jgi:hypothetical protein